MRTFSALSLLFCCIDQVRELGDAVYHYGNVVAEVFSKVVNGVGRIFNDIMKKTGGDGVVVHA